MTSGSRLLRTLAVLLCAIWAGACTTESQGFSGEAPSIVTETLPPAKAGFDYKEALDSEGGEKPLVWALVDSPFDWLQLDEFGALTGKPKFKSDERLITVTVRDAAQLSSTRQLTLSVGACLDDDKCSVSIDGKCMEGTLLCTDGSFGECIDPQPVKDELDGCGPPTCEKCRPRANRCEKGQCYCGEGTTEKSKKCAKGENCCTDPKSVTGRRCSNPNTDPKGCGNCGTACADGGANTLATCVGGKCGSQCQAGFANCTANPAVTACAINLQNDPLNCGSCGNICPAIDPATHASASCVAGKCVPSCEPGFDRCKHDYSDGCPVFKAPDAKHCGDCDNDCTLKPNVLAASCENSTCGVVVCQSGFGDCNGDPRDGCESRLDSLPNCSACGEACARPHTVQAACQSYFCAVTQCEAGWGDCKNSAIDGCETQLNTKANCGACGRACSGENAVGLPYLCNQTLLRCCPAGGSSGCL